LYKDWITDLYLLKQLQPGSNLPAEIRTQKYFSDTHFQCFTKREHLKTEKCQQQQGARGKDTGFILTKDENKETIF